VLQLDFTAADFARLRFAHSPLAEVVASSFALHRPGRLWMYTTWRATVQPMLAKAQLDTLLAAVDGPTCYVPDFLTPVPSTARPSLEQELATVAATPLDRVAAEMDAAWTGHPTPPAIQRFATDPAGGLTELIQQVRRYFQLAIAPLWPRLRVLVEREIQQRARVATDRGPSALVSNLHSQLDWNGSALQLASAKERRWTLDGHPLTLLPSGFAGPMVYPMTEGVTGRALWYGPRGYGDLWNAAVAPPALLVPPAALAALLGPTRAAVLTLLSTPHSTGEVANALRLAPATASHHLTTLRDAGLVTNERDGRRLRYLRTPLGDELSTAV
jgi:hypothetical protein